MADYAHMARYGQLDPAKRGGDVLKLLRQREIKTRFEENVDEFDQ